MFNALKLCTTLSLIGAVVGEFFGGPAFRALGVFIKSENAIAHNKEAGPLSSSPVALDCYFTGRWHWPNAG